MPNDPLIEEYVERFHEYRLKQATHCSDCEKYILNFLRTSLKEYGDKRVGEVMNELKAICNKSKTERGLSVAIGNFITQKQ